MDAPVGHGNTANPVDEDEVLVGLSSVWLGTPVTLTHSSEINVCVAIGNVMTLVPSGQPKGNVIVVVVGPATMMFVV